MENEAFDYVKFEKAKAIARFNRFLNITKLWQIFEVVVALTAVSWSSMHIPAAVKIFRDFLFEVSLYLFNHHVVFLLGNAIIILVVVLCRKNDAVNASCDVEFYEDYEKHGEFKKDVASPPPRVEAETSAAAACDGDEVAEDEKQIVVFPQANQDDDDVAAAIEKATRQIKRFQRTQSEKLRREISMRPRRQFRRSETQMMTRSADRCTAEMTSFDVEEMETLSNEDFQRTIEAYIKKHRNKIT